jgi:hypothetical protein
MRLKSQTLKDLKISDTQRAGRTKSQTLRDFIPFHKNSDTQRSKGGLKEELRHSKILFLGKFRCYCVSKNLRHSKIIFFWTVRSQTLNDFVLLYVLPLLRFGSVRWKCGSQGSRKGAKSQRSVFLQEESVVGASSASSLRWVEVHAAVRNISQMARNSKRNSKKLRHSKI